jgi:hypothetical protein
MGMRFDRAGLLRRVAAVIGPARGHLFAACVPAAFWALATAASSSRCDVRPKVTGSLGWILAMFQCVRSRIAAIVVRVVPISREI